MRPISSWFETREDALLTMRSWCGGPYRPDDFFPPYSARMISSNLRNATLAAPRHGYDVVARSEVADTCC
jgi:hypothetical protein